MKSGSNSYPFKNFENKTEFSADKSLENIGTLLKPLFETRVACQKKKIHS